MLSSNKRGLQVINKEAIITRIREAIGKHRNIVISGEEGVGKITNTLEALRDTANVYYIGNPVDYVGKPRPKGYDKYINYIMSLKKDMHIIAGEEELLSFDPASLPEEELLLVVDEVYGRSEAQYDKIIEFLQVEKAKVFLITGCLKNVGRIIQSINAGLMLTKDGVILYDREFAIKICSILSPEPL